MTTYVDSSALVPVYVPERFSAVARRTVQALSQVPYTALHALEIPNAFALLAGRSFIRADQHEAVRAQLQDDVEAQRLVPVALDWDVVFESASELSDSHTAALLTRSLDVIHVAAAVALACRVFVSADDRQLALARAVGLRIVDVKRPSSRAR